MGKGKNKGQSINRKLKRGIIDLNGSSLKRPFNNSKRNKNSFQLEREKFYFAMKDYLNHIKNKDDNTETD
jgi:hypothetical protein